MGLLFCENVTAQNCGLQFPFGISAIQGRPNIILPISRGATVWLTYLDVYAANRIAARSFIESVARINLINGHALFAHIAADRAAIKYHVERLSGFYQEMNEDFRREMNLLMHERDVTTDELMDSLIIDQLQYVLRHLDIAVRWKTYGFVFNSLTGWQSTC